MNSSMTFNTNGHNVKWLGIVGMVVVSCLFSTRTQQRICSWYLSSHDCLLDYSASHSPLRMPFSVFFGLSSMFNFAFFSFLVFKARTKNEIFALFALLISLPGDLTLLGLLMAFDTIPAFVAFTEPFLVGFIIFPLVVCSFAILTPNLKSVLSRSVFVKFRNWLNFFASTTVFCYDLLKHGFFLSKKLCLELITAHTVVGSFYSNRLILRCQDNFT